MPITHRVNTHSTTITKFGPSLTATVAWINYRQGRLTPMQREVPFYAGFVALSSSSGFGDGIYMAGIVVHSMQYSEYITSSYLTPAWDSITKGATSSATIAACIQNEATPDSPLPIWSRFSAPVQLYKRNLSPQWKALYNNGRPNGSPAHPASTLAWSSI